MTSSVKAKLTFKCAILHQWTIQSWLLIIDDSNYNLIQCVTETVLDYMHDLKKIICVIILIWMHQLQQRKLNAVICMLNYDMYPFRNIWKFIWQINGKIFHIVVNHMTLPVQDLKYASNITFHISMICKLTAHIHQFTYCLFAASINIEVKRLKSKCWYLANPRQH